jgi:hypothetical protein
MARRYAIWVDTATFMAAQALAERAGSDVDTFIEFVVKGLHDEARAGALRAATTQEPGGAPVIPMNEDWRRRRWVPGQKVVHDP